MFGSWVGGGGGGVHDGRRRSLVKAAEGSTIKARKFRCMRQCRYTLCTYVYGVKVCTVVGGRIAGNKKDLNKITKKYRRRTLCAVGE